MKIFSRQKLHFLEQSFEVKNIESYLLCQQMYNMYKIYLYIPICLKILTNYSR